MTVPGQENAEFIAPKNLEKSGENSLKIDTLQQSDQAVEALRGSLKTLGGQPDLITSPPKTDFEKHMQQIENRGNTIVQQASVLQEELKSLNKEAEKLKAEGSKNREKIETYLGDLTKNLPEGNQHSDSIRNTIKNLPNYLTEADVEKIMEGARWDAAKAGLSQGDFDTMSPAEKSVVRERVQKMKSDSLPKMETSESQEFIIVAPGKEREVTPVAPHSAPTTLPEDSVKKANPVVPESRAQSSIKPAPSIKKSPSAPAAVPPPVFAPSGNIQTVEFGGWGEDKKPEPPHEKPQVVVAPPMPPEVAENTQEEDVPVPVPENSSAPERKKILGDSVSILREYGTNKILKNRTPKGDFVAVSERGTIYIGKDIGGRDQGNGIKSITRHDMEIRLDNEGYVQSAENVRNGFEPIAPNDLKEYVGYLNSMGIICKIRQ